jgi:hypothetical protein
MERAEAEVNSTGVPTLFGSAFWVVFRGRFIAVLQARSRERSWHRGRRL